MTSFVPSMGAAPMPRARLRGDQAHLCPLKTACQSPEHGTRVAGGSGREAAVSAASVPLVNEFLALGPALTRAGVGAPPNRTSRRSEPGRISGRILTATVRGSCAARSADGCLAERVTVGRHVHSRVAGGDADERLTGRRKAEELALRRGRPLEEALERGLLARARPGAEAHPVRALRPEDDVEGEAGACRRPEGRAAVERAHRVEEDGDTPVQPRTPR